MKNFKEEVKELRKSTIDIQYKNLYNKLFTNITSTIKRNVSNIENLSIKQVFCCIDFDTNVIKISKDIFLQVVNEIFNDLDIADCIRDISFKHESNYQDSFYRLTFYYNVEE